jgi:hypothetical protein
MEYLNKQQESFCENAGLAGVLISLTCLIQHMVFMLPHWIMFVIVGVYIFCITAFILLMKKIQTAPLLLLINAGLIFLIEVFMIFSLAFSPVIIILLLYVIVITVVLYMGTIPAQLKKRSIALKEDNAQWDSVL